MNIVALCEHAPESRVALTPSVAKAYSDLGCTLSIIEKAGDNAGFSDELYIEKGVSSEKAKVALAKADILLSVNPPRKTELKKLSPSSILITQLNDPHQELIQYCLDNSISLINVNNIPRISRAQNMDTLSSQANLAGYKAVLLAVNAYQRAVPMMMTAAGMIHPAKVLILGAGVAGLQAIATAKRLGAEVFAFDVRRAAREQVESLGAEFVEVSDEDLETSGGYAAETSEAYKEKQAKLIDEYAQKADIIITTALIPNRPAPLLIHKETIEKMKPGSIIVDMATARGGNCELSVKDSIVLEHEVEIIGYSNLAGMVAKTASELYAHNLLQIVKLLINTEDKTINLNPDDIIIQNILICHQGESLPFLKEDIKA